MLAKRRKQRTTDNGQRPRSRGVTLVEMLVTVAVLVIMMTILVQIFQAATGSVSAAQAYQQLDDQLRRLDGIIRADLEGVTAKFTPPLDPAQNRGYFEYGENEYADNQGEDGDDYIRFTAKAPAGQPFTGRFWVTSYTYNSPSYLDQPQPITITSDFAEIIYFVRNGNLYRRVFLVVPEMQKVIQQAVNNQVPSGNNTVNWFYPTIFGGDPANLKGTPVSWQAVNDLSAHPSPTGNSTTTIVLNTLGHLTNRENRAFYPRFANDFLSITASNNNAQPDGIPDDLNGDNVPDLYPTLYPNVFNTSLIYSYPNSNMSGFNTIAAATHLMAFPYVFPGAYSRAQTVSSGHIGWIHAPSPYAFDAATPTPHHYQFDTNTLLYLQNLNHNPLDFGDNLPTPPANVAIGGKNAIETQTWWGFPTWRETLSSNWTDPTAPLFTNASQPAGLTYGAWNTTNLDFSFLTVPNGFVNVTNANLLPPMVSSWTSSSGPVTFPNFRNPDQLFCDGAGANSAFVNATLWPLSWEDDLIMTGVRSFDVKAYDNVLGDYADLGWGDDLRLYLPYQNLTGDQNLSGVFNPSTPPYINTSNPFPKSMPTNTITWPPVDPTVNTTMQIHDLYNETFAHEGRMPPLLEDNRLDSQNPNPNYTNQTTFVPQYPAVNRNYSSNIGDDTPGIVRLRRVWDSWSTDYSRAPATGVDPTSSFPIGPPFSPPVYPSYPAPYPAPLRGIQIQIRVADPTNQRIKSLTIRQDFTDKL